MRSAEKIKETLRAIEDAWLAHPELRLGQLLVNAVASEQPCPELFHMPDAALVCAVRDFAHRAEPEKPVPIGQMTEAEKELVAALGGDIEFHVKSLLILNSSSDWKKTARVAGGVLSEFGRQGVDLPESFVVDMLEQLIASAHLESAGDVRQLRHSEVRLNWP